MAQQTGNDLLSYCEHFLKTSHLEGGGVRIDGSIDTSLCYGFMNAMQQFKVQSCKSFPSHGDVLRVACSLGYRKLVPFSPDELDFDETGDLEDDQLDLSLSGDSVA